MPTLLFLIISLKYNKLKYFIAFILGLFLSLQARSDIFCQLFTIFNAVKLAGCTVHYVHQWFFDHKNHLTLHQLQVLHS